MDGTVPQGFGSILEISITQTFNVPSKQIKALSEEQVDNIIRMAWCDRTTFETIQEKTQFTENNVIELMRTKLKRKSFNIWRARVTGRLTKHRKCFRQERKTLQTVLDGTD